MHIIFSNELSSHISSMIGFSEKFKKNVNDFSLIFPKEESVKVLDSFGIFFSFFEKTFKFFNDYKVSTSKETFVLEIEKFAVFHDNYSNEVVILKEEGESLKKHLEGVFALANENEKTSEIKEKSFFDTFASFYIGETLRSFYDFLTSFLKIQMLFNDLFKSITAKILENLNS